MAVTLAPITSIQGQPVTKGSHLILLCPRPPPQVSSHQQSVGFAAR